MSVEKYETFSEDMQAPLGDGFDITTHNSTDMEFVTRAIMISTAGDVSLVFQNGAEITLTALLPGVLYPFRVKRINSTGTTATGIKGFM